MKTINTKITKGATFSYVIDCSLTLDALDPASVIISQIRANDDTIIATFTSVKNLTAKTLTISLDATTSAALVTSLNKSYYYDVVVTSVNGTKYQLITGNVGFNSVVSK